MKTFNALNVSSKYAICGVPLRVDTYKNCGFGCKYCFANNRVVCEFAKELQIANLVSLQKRLDRVLAKGNAKEADFIDTLIKNRITWHCGGMSDPFQPIEKKLQITKQMIDICNQYGITILFSTKSDNVYGADIRPELHTFQLSVTNTENRKDIEPNVPDIERRYKFYKELKEAGFSVGIRIQPFIPNVTTLEIVKMFEDADNFTLEGIKIVPQNKEHKEYLLDILRLNKDDFTQMGLLNLKPKIRLEMYRQFIEYFERHNIPFSIADNDLHYIGTNKCCCGDNLIYKSTDFNNTAMLKKYGFSYSKNDIDGELLAGGVCECKACHLVTSNRTEGCRTVQDFYDKRFDRKSSPFSPLFQYSEQPTIFDYLEGK